MRSRARLSVDDPDELHVWMRRQRLGQLLPGESSPHAASIE
jgi:hypothetical protein